MWVLLRGAHGVRFRALYAKIRFHLVARLGHRRRDGGSVKRYVLRGRGGVEVYDVRKRVGVAGRCSMTASITLTGFTQYFPVCIVSCRLGCIATRMSVFV